MTEPDPVMVATEALTGRLRAEIGAQLERTGGALPAPGQAGPVMARVAWLLAAPGPERRARLAEDVGVNSEGNVLYLLAEGLAAARQYDAAVAAADAAGGPTNFFSSVAHGVIAGHLAAGGQWDRAFAAAGKARNYRPRALASMAAATGNDPARAVQLAAQAETEARRVLDSFWRAKALSDVAVAVADVDPERAMRLATEAAEAVERGIQPTPIGKIAGVLAAHGDQNRAQRVARALRDLEDRAWAAVGVGGVLALQGQAGDATEIIRTLMGHSPYVALPLATIAAIIAPADPENAIQLAQEAHHTAGTVTDRNVEIIIHTAHALRIPLPLNDQPSQMALHGAADDLLQLALADKSWYAALPIFGQIEPGVVLAIHQTLVDAV